MKYPEKLETKAANHIECLCVRSHVSRAMFDRGSVNVNVDATEEISTLVEILFQYLINSRVSLIKDTKLTITKQVPYNKIELVLE